MTLRRTAPAIVLALTMLISVPSAHAVTSAGDLGAGFLARLEPEASRITVGGSTVKAVQLTLWNRAARPGTVEILDAGGEVIETLSVRSGEFSALIVPRATAAEYAAVRWDPRPGPAVIIALRGPAAG